uniref:Evolutionarily conserved signaling intermediate in Toll pathway, mitochondrial n=1 Tax=Ditylenchus dipsaci TaxID=166011 RepID=A0A915CXK9_9BILA
MHRLIKGYPTFVSFTTLASSSGTIETLKRRSAVLYSSSQRSISNDALKLDKRQVQRFEEKFKKASPEDRTKENFLAAAALFRNAHGRRSVGYLEYIATALRYLEEYGLQKDLDVYKALLNCFPKGVLVPTTRFQKMFMHHPHQQACCVTILDQMEWFGCYPDKEVHDIVNALLDAKAQYTNKYLDAREVDNDNLKDAELARLALKMMCRDSGTVFSYVKTPSSEFDFGSFLKIRVYFVDGPSRVYVTDKSVSYVVFSSSSTQTEDEEFIDQRDVYEYSNLRQRLFDEGQEANTNIHQQSDQTILAMAVLEENTQG